MLNRGIVSKLFLIFDKPEPQNPELLNSHFQLSRRVGALASSTLGKSYAWVYKVTSLKLFKDSG